MCREFVSFATISLVCITFACPDVLREVIVEEPAYMRRASVHFLNQFVDDGAYGFAGGFGAAPEFFVVCFADVDGDAGL